MQSEEFWIPYKNPLDRKDTQILSRLLYQVSRFKWKEKICCDRSETQETM